MFRCVVTCYKVAGGSETGSYSFPTIGGFGQCSIEVVSIHVTGTLRHRLWNRPRRDTDYWSHRLHLPSLTNQRGSTTCTLPASDLLEPSATMPSSTGFT